LPWLNGGPRSRQVSVAAVAPDSGEATWCPVSDA